MSFPSFLIYAFSLGLLLQHVTAEFVPTKLNDQNFQESRGILNKFGKCCRRTADCFVVAFCYLKSLFTGDRGDARRESNILDPNPECPDSPGICKTPWDLTRPCLIDQHCPSDYTCQAYFCKIKYPTIEEFGRK